MSLFAAAFVGGMTVWLINYMEDKKTEKDLTQMYYDKYGMSSGVVHRQVEGEGGPRGQGRAFPSNQHCPADDSVPNRLSGGGRWKERERERESKFLGKGHNAFKCPCEHS